jgi:sterol desaturase/sphingolipid hydroxylase (fatty acid hydroxylase superfamily)
VWEFLQKALSNLGAPFASWKAFWFAILGGPRALTELSSRTGWPYLLSSLLIAWVIFRSTKRIHGHESFVRFMFPHDIWGHPSAVADYKYAAVSLCTRFLFVLPLASGLSYVVYESLRQVLPVIPGQWVTNPIARGVLLSVALVVIADLAFFISHYLMHQIPLLWQFHELHHSAQVLTPVTVYRTHPVEDLMNNGVTAVVAAIAGIFYGSLSGRECDLLTVFGVNGIFMLFYLFAYQLRHSHVWLSYGPVLNRLLISPAQHQIHHSVDPKHWNKNYGNILAVWDLLFNSLYVPRHRETLQFGVPGLDAREFATVPRMYFRPFVKAGRVVAATFGRSGQRYKGQGERKSLGDE